MPQGLLLKTSTSKQSIDLPSITFIQFWVHHKVWSFTRQKFELWSPKFELSKSKNKTFISGLICKLWMCRAIDCLWIAGPDLSSELVHAAFKYSLEKGMPLAAFLGDTCATLEMQPELEVDLILVSQLKQIFWNNHSFNLGWHKIAENTGKHCVWYVVFTKLYLYYYVYNTTLKGNRTRSWNSHTPGIHQTLEFWYFIV